MKIIYKYQVDIPGSEIEMPAGAKILSAGVQNEGVYIWAEVDRTQPPKPRAIVAYPTGAAYDDIPKKFIDTVHLSGGALVFHLFELDI